MSDFDERRKEAESKRIRPGRLTRTDVRIHASFLHGNGTPYDRLNDELMFYIRTFGEKK